MHKKKWLSVLIGTIIGTMSLPASVFAADSATALPKTEGKPRLLVTQDGEVDDMNTLIHTLLYSNDIDLEGIVQTSSITVGMILQNPLDGWELTGCMNFWMRMQRFMTI